MREGLSALGDPRSGKPPLALKLRRYDLGLRNFGFRVSGFRFWGFGVLGLRFQGF